MSSPNLESCNNELSKFGAHLGEATYRNNLDNPDCLLTDSWLTPDRLLKDSKKSILRSQFGELSQWALQIWRAISMSSPNLKLILKVHLGKPGPPHGPHKHLGGPKNGKLSKRALQIWFYCLFTFCSITILDCNSYYSLIPMSTIKSGCNMSYILS